VLYAGRQNDDVTSRIILSPLFGSALASTLKNNDNFLGLVVMPWHYDPGADYVFMNVGLGPQLSVCDEVANPSF
jgi:hypothetical protein